ncbi:MAG TPA: hypothetical protein VFH51_06550, partial [Myxococcota bacterium]|nr:hypothetical protein [Myxococcota bacterium]
MRQSLLGALSTGLLLCLAHGYLPELALVAPVPLLWVLPRASRREAFYAGLVAGLGEGCVLAGTWHAHPLIALGLCLFCGLEVLLFALAWRVGGLHQGPWGPPAAGALWALAEWCGASTPFSLPAILGDTQHRGPFLALAR